MKTITCVLVDPLPLSLKGALASLEHEPDIEVVASTEHPAEGIELVSSCAPDVAIIGLLSNEIEAQGVLKALRDMYGTHIILLTGDLSEPVVYQSMMTADGYMHRRAVADLPDAIRRVVAGDYVLCPAALRAYVGAARSGHHHVRDTSAGPPLSEREKQVLTLIAEGADRKEAAEELELSLNTIKSHLANAYAKLGVNRQAEAITEAIKQGQIDVSGDRARTDA